MVRKLSPNKAEGLSALYARYLIAFSSYSAMGLIAGSLTALALKPSFRGLKFFSLLGAGMMGGIATHQSIQEYNRTLQTYKKHNTNPRLFEESALAHKKEKDLALSQSIQSLEELKRSLTPKN